MSTQAEARHKYSDRCPEEEILDEVMGIKDIENTLQVVEHRWPE